MSACGGKLTTNQPVNHSTKKQAPTNGWHPGTTEGTNEDDELKNAQKILSSSQVDTRSLYKLRYDVFVCIITMSAAVKG